ncbi:MAG: hypothetical protein RSE93_07810 [Oscillospiraceae bacterium]
MKILEFFLGCNTSNGFVGFQEELQQPKLNWRSYLIKGGSGTGKSTFIKSTLKGVNSEGLTEVLHCSSDVNSLDGIILHNEKVSILDATPPHAIEPKLIGCYQSYINLTQFFNEGLLSKRVNDIKQTQAENLKYHQKCCKLLNGANVFLSENQKIISEYVNLEKIEKTAEKIVKKEFRKKGETIINKRFLTAVTNEGVITFTDTINQFKNIYLIKDDIGYVSKALLTYILLKLKGEEVYCCYNPITLALEHIFIPDLDLAFVTQNKFTDLSKVSPVTVINYTRFLLDKTIPKQLIYFYQKVAKGMVDEACQSLKTAKSIHDKLESFYIDAVDFKGVSALNKEIIKKINICK